MGIRTKIALGFVILTVAVIALVSFWAAQSLGFTVDSSDLIYLENIKNSITRNIATFIFILKIFLAFLSIFLNSIFKINFFNSLIL